MATQQVERAAGRSHGGRAPASGSTRSAASSSRAASSRRLVEEDSLRGVTSNPTIFNQAILGSPDYDDQLGQLAREGSGDARDLPGRS